MSGPLPVELAVVGPRPLRGRLRLAGDKSVSHRALLFAALATGPCRLSNLADGDDVVRTRAALGALGVSVRAAAGGVVVVGTGFAGLAEPDDVIDCGNSGTAVRLLAGLLAGRPGLAVLTGDASVRRRPMGRVVEPLRSMGARIDGRDGGRRAPLAVSGGSLRGRRHELAVASAQVKTASVLAGLQADGRTEVTEPARSRDHTERLLAALGAPIERVPGGVAVEPAPDGLAAFDLEVPGDPSTAAFFVVGACVTPGSDIVVEDVCLNPTRIGFVDVLRRMGVAVETVVKEERAGEPVGEIRAASGPLRGTRVAGAEIPGVIDEIPALAVAAAFAEGETSFADAGELRVKESDRIGTIAQELSQLGVEVEERPDGLRITGGRPRPAVLKSHGDHRVAMAGAIAVNACAGASTVRGWRAVASSAPGFAAALADLTGVEERG